ncbi:hypothetical protein GP475_08865 [Corynebacterium poyangense]|uniref:Uncharacterized protein n=1 Tax=Corynebacterium poyangense TaxID=2684405 RepID=A0A7H0SQB2_9CORY|nr:hypothetical protein [Corynebacterium poyangense]QNQ90737.1 hypothetical protein GP475_08865 [Corynebacterium poyangense]
METPINKSTLKMSIKKELQELTQEFNETNQKEKTMDIRDYQSEALDAYRKLIIENYDGLSAFSECEDFLFGMFIFNMEEPAILESYKRFRVKILGKGEE